ncbi:hypothetical protein DKX38_016170 [Salix brachista]|uniref:Wound-induced protein 1 n=1 Tax=Salix brachista TaxID=2182728 RepID=A0A5N5L798_9ROSI|nr:hypothetical protein DKX38_016170 [Salix brachista]
MMRLLTGEQKDNDVPFQFSPISITSFGNLVIVEGWDTSSISWVHAWTVTDGIITQVREYFNTSLTVTRLGNQSQPSDFKSKSKSSSTSEISLLHCPSVWESSLSKLVVKVAEDGLDGETYLVSTPCPCNLLFDEVGGESGPCSLVACLFWTVYVEFKTWSASFEGAAGLQSPNSPSDAVMKGNHQTTYRK